MKKIFVLLVVATFCFGFSSTGFALTADYTTIADGTYSSISLAGTTVTGSSNVVSANFAGFRGLGIEGQGSLGNGADVSLDVGETMFFDLGTLASNTTLTLVDIDPPGNVTFSFEAFLNSVSLGVFDFPFASTAPETFDLFALSGNQYMTDFSVSVFSPSAPLGLQIQSVSFTPVPEPSTFLLLGGGLAGLAFVIRRRRKE